RRADAAPMTLRRLAPLLVAALCAVPAAAQRPRRAPPTARRPAPAPQAVRIPTPRSVLGFDPGEDRKLADWPTLVRYYQALAQASDRVDFKELGKSTLGAPFVALVISNPANLRRLDAYRHLNARLADPRTLASTREGTEA